MSAERLQRILARAGVASRRHAEDLIAAGRVTVNGRVAGLGDKADPERDTVKVDGKRIEPRRAGTYLLLNKPRAVMSTLADPEGRPTVLDLVPPARRKALVAVGRLDFLTEGLMILTDDGELAQRIAHPRYGCGKTYEAKVRGRPSEVVLEKLRRGIVLAGRRTAPARITRRKMPRATGRPEPAGGGNTWWTVELSEGRTRQIREMFARIGHPVTKLRRVAIGPVADPRLAPGEVRELTERELEALRRATDPERPRSAGSAAKTPARSRVGWAKAKTKGKPKTAGRARATTETRNRGGDGSGGAPKGGPRSGARRPGGRRSR